MTQSLNKKAFTLIELLVVIAIIGLLSSVILVAVQDARDKADIAKVLQYSASVHSALGAYIVGEWRFEDNLNDTSGYGNHGTWENTGGSAPGGNFVDGVPGADSKGLNFNGSDDYVRIDNSTSLQVIGDLTIDAWIYPEDISQGRQGIVFKHYNYEYEVIMQQNTGVIIFYHGNGTWESMNVGMLVSENKWNHIVIVRTMDSNKISFYLNGKFIGDDNFTITPVSSTNSVIIGSRLGTSYFFDGIIDEVHIYEKELTSAQIQKLYAEGAKRHNIAYE